jgi:hypothetical protein
MGEGEGAQDATQRPRYRQRAHDSSAGNGTGANQLGHVGRPLAQVE